MRRRLVSTGVSGDDRPVQGEEILFTPLLPLEEAIYLLTDGQPSGGRFTDAADIVEQVRLMNRSRQIVIHCISIGQRSTLLQDLAALTGGTYKEVR